MSVRAFLDTNILIYAVGADPHRTPAAERLLLAGGYISVQVLNEFVAVARRKLNMAWPDVHAALSSIRQLCAAPTPLDGALHDAGLVLAERHNLSIYDALIVAAAQAARCEVVYSADMHHGHRFDGGLRIENPFAP
ncbi:MAG TPA: PIN domain-containing protein [Caulobacteraceae bacterium]